MTLMNKPKYKCKLVSPIEAVHTMGCAYIIRLEDHVVLGPPPTEGAKLTRTSRVVCIDEEKKEIETLNSIYCYGEP